MRKPPPLNRVQTTSAIPRTISEGHTYTLPLPAGSGYQKMRTAHHRCRGDRYLPNTGRNRLKFFFLIPSFDTSFLSLSLSLFSLSLGLRPLGHPFGNFVSTRRRRVPEDKKMMQTRPTLLQREKGSRKERRRKSKNKSSTWIC
jgi:hypothetical protein